MNRLTAIAGVVMLTAGLASANDLNAYKSTYEKRLDDLILSHGIQMTELGQQYIKSLEKLLAKIKKAGDLDKTTAVMEEVARFRNERGIPATPSELPDLQYLQSLFTKQASIQEAENAKSIISLISRYDQALERLQKDLVSSDKLDDARAVKDERERVQTSDTYQSAKTLAISHDLVKQPNKVDQDDRYTLTVITKTGLGMYDPSDGSDRVRIFVFLGSDDGGKQELQSAGFGRGSEIRFEGIEFDYPLEKIDKISFLCQGGTDAWGMESVSFQFFKGHRQSKLYIFDERTSFSGEGSDAATTLKSFPIPGGVKINRVFLRAEGLK